MGRFELSQIYFVIGTVVETERLSAYFDDVVSVFESAKENVIRVL